MSDLVFVDAGFSATTVAVRWLTEAGRAFASQFLSIDPIACGAVLRKSFAYDMMSAAGAQRVAYTVTDREEA